MRELFALTIDRATSAEVARINKEIGRSISFTGYQRSRSDTSLSRLDPSYQCLLTEYVQLKLILHHTRKTMYYRDLYTEREDINLVNVRERCAELREQIKAKRRTINYAAWGDLTPFSLPTPYDKPILHAMDEHTCSFVTGEDDDSIFMCPLQGRYWFHGKPYCRAHMRESRSLLNKERNKQKLEQQNQRVAEHYGQAQEVWAEK